MAAAVKPILLALIPNNHTTEGGDTGSIIQIVWSAHTVQEISTAHGLQQKDLAHYDTQIQRSQLGANL